MLDIIAGDLADDQLHWLEPFGAGFYDVDAWLDRNGRGLVYDDAYFQKYQRMADSPIGEALNAFRVDLLHRVSDPDCLVLDVGIGDGAFLRAAEDELPRLRLRGCDINPAAIRYLEAHGQLGSIELTYDVVTFWDSLEHFRDPRIPLRAAGRFALVSLPVFPDSSAALRSKHFRPDEHFWYFSPRGFVAFAEGQGFQVVDQLETENYLGREGISTFILKRRGAG